MREPDFRQFLSLVALEHVEEKYDLRLSRALATPNIASKGKLESRSVVVPVYGNPQIKAASVTPKLAETSSPVTAPPRSKPLIEEIGGVSPSTANGVESEPTPKTPIWSLTTLGNNEIRLDLEMPDLTRELAEQGSLDVEARRIIFSAGSPAIYEFDKTFPSTKRDFRVDQARAEWNVTAKKLSIFL